jgi:hypothetical protein
MNDVDKQKLKNRIFKTKHPITTDGYQLIQHLKHDSSVFVPNRLIFKLLKDIYDEDFAYESFSEYFSRKDRVDVEENVQE